MVYMKKSITLVIAVKNESGTIEKLWDSVLAQTYKPVRVIFVDGGSSDDTLILLRRIESADERVAVVESPGARPGEGRNIGIEMADTEWIAITDAGIVLCSDWLEQLVRVADSNPESVVVYGNYEPIIGSFFEKCASLAYVAPKVVRRGVKMRGPSIASSLLKRSVWREVGGFPASRAAEDLFFMQKISERGFVTEWAPVATVNWQLRPDLSSTYRKFVLYSKHNVWIGMQRYWHYGVARQYLAFLLIAILAMVHSCLWLLLVLGLLLLRAGLSIWRRTEGHRLSEMLNPLQLLVVLGVILIIDLATFTGWLQALIARPEAVYDEG